jgi:ferrous iron transport protein B
LLEGAVTKPKGQSQALTKFDKKAISRRWGKLIAIGIILAGLIGSMVVAAPIMGVGMSLSSLLNPLVTSGLEAISAPQWLISLICSTLITALGWTLSMLGFVFGINLVFGLIEEVGYMARISYIFDNAMSKLGLQGKSVMPMLCSFGCTIGGAAGTRVIDSWGQKVLTIALLWAVPCGATWAVVPTLANAFFGWGGILVVLGLFLVMFFHMMITAKIFGKKLSPKAERTGLIMELPPYHKPRWGALFHQTLNRVWSIFKKAFVVVFGVAAVFWLLSYSTSGVASDSILYKVGVFIEPATKTFGMGWQTFMAFVSSMVSKEAVLGVLSALFTGSGTLFDSTTGAAVADAGIMDILVNTISKPEALAFIFAVTYNVPCVMAVASTYQESHSLKWTIRIVLYYIASALLLSFLVFHIASIFC